ncbi:dynamin family protein [Aeromonas sanarellii]
MSNIIDESLTYRQGKIDEAKGYLTRTCEVFEQFGSTELKTVSKNLDGILNALDANDVRLVVLGEFSRGKSSLVNALLGIQLLPTALQATTAINTFVRALQDGREDRHIVIHFQDGRAPQEVAWTDEQCLTRWGTELDTKNADVRKTLDYIEVFMAHPLLEKGLVLIDTPGLESVVQHHEEITRKAISEAHIALWVQNTTQLGGSASEWAFLSDTLRTSFNKFITVIGWWDQVLEPQDLQDQNKPETLRVREKLDLVRNNFRAHLADLPTAEIDKMTGGNHLIGVSANWALSGDEEKRRRSGIADLATNISDLFNSGEAFSHIFRKPLQQLHSIQCTLADMLDDEMQQLDSSKTLEERQRELEIFEKDIQLLEGEVKHVRQESAIEHDNARASLVSKISRDLVMPLSDLKSQIELQVDQRYVERLIESRTKLITLPTELDEDMLKVSELVARRWAECRGELAEVLEALRADYATQMEKHAGQLQGEMSRVEIDIPKLDVRFNLDLSAIEQYHKQALELDQKITARREELDVLGQEISRNTTNEAKLEMARQAVLRAERAREQLGSQPAVQRYSTTEKVSDGGMYSSPKYETVTRTDNSAAKAWEKEYESRQAIVENKEARLAQIIEEEELKTGVRMNLDRALKKYEREVAKFESEKQCIAEKMRAEQAETAQKTLRRLLNSTAGQLEQSIRYLQDNATVAVSRIFTEQLELLNRVVEEQYFEPLKAKHARREEVKQLLESGQQEIAKRKRLLAQAQLTLQALQTETDNALHS